MKIGYPIKNLGIRKIGHKMFALKLYWDQEELLTMHVEKNGRITFFEEKKKKMS